MAGYGRSITENDHGKVNISDVCIFHGMTLGGATQKGNWMHETCLYFLTTLGAFASDKDHPVSMFKHALHQNLPATTTTVRRNQVIDSGCYFIPFLRIHLPD